MISAIKGTIKTNNAATDLAKHLLTEVTSQLTELLALLSDWHEDLTEQCDYQSTQAWQFIGLSVRAMMDFLVPPRMAVSAITNFTLPENKASVIWAVLSEHIRMKELVVVDFKSHHVVTTAMSNFIMKTRVDRSLVTQVEDKASVNTKAITATDKRLATLETDLKSVKQTHGNKIAALEKKKR